MRGYRCARHRIKTLAAAYAVAIATLLGPLSPVQEAYAQGNRPDMKRVLVGLNGPPNNDDVGVVNALGGTVHRAFSIVNAMVVSAPDTPAFDRLLLNDAKFTYVEPDLRAHIVQQSLPSGIDRVEADQNTTANINGKLTGLSNVDIAILDTGIDIDHPDLNVVDGRRFYTANSGPPWQRGQNEDGQYDDDNGHGTHVAGTAAALDNDTGVVGMAPGANLWAVKVLDSSGSGYISDIVAGIQWVTEHANQIEVANMSLGAQGQSQTLRNAIQASVDAGIVYTVAAGNNGADVYGSDGEFGTSDDYIPAAYPEVATISALADSDGQSGGLGGTTSYGPDDSFATFSNFSSSVADNNPVDSPGAAIDLIMPGVDITSTWMGGGYDTASGTSMASPHAAGLVALHIVANDLTPTSSSDVTAIRQALIDSGVDQTSGDRLTSDHASTEPDGSPEHLGWANSGPSTSVAITPSSAQKSADDGTELTYTYTVENTGETEDTYSLSVDATWEASVLWADGTTGSRTLAVGDTAGVEVTHTIPSGKAPGDSDTGTVTVSSSDGTGASSSATFTSTAEGYAVEITPSTQEGSGAPGETVAYTYTVSNTGTSEDTYDFETSSTTWNSDLSSSSETVSAGESVEVTVDHTIASGATDGSSDTGTLTASSSNASANASATFTTTASVNTSPTTIAIAPVNWSTHGGKDNNKHLDATLTLTDDQGNLVANASVVVTVALPDGSSWSASDTTGSNGQVTFTRNNASSGTYELTVDSVSHSTLTWDGDQPTNASYTK